MRRIDWLTMDAFSSCKAINTPCNQLVVSTPPFCDPNNQVFLVGSNDESMINCIFC